MQQNKDISKCHISSKVLKLGNSFQYVIHLVFDKLSESKVANLLHIGELSNSYFEILTVE